MHENAIVYLLLVVFLIGMMLRAVGLSVTFFLVKTILFPIGTERTQMLFLFLFLPNQINSVSYSLFVPL